MTYTPSHPKPDLKRWQHVADDLQRAISLGQIRPGERIPTEQELLALYGYSRSVVRTALAHLRHLGILETKLPGGTYVVER